MLHQLVTPHDEFQDGLLLFMFVVMVANSWFLARHLIDHKRWREKGMDADQRQTGTLGT